MVSIKDRFKEFTANEYYSLVDDSLVSELFIGLDDKGRKTIKLRAPFEPQKIIGTTGIDIRQYKNYNYGTIQFSLCNEGMSSLFYLFCEDLVKVLSKILDVTLSYQAVVNRFFQWKKMFNNGNMKKLTESEIMGLIGEILLLKDLLFEKYGEHKALKGWSGQELTHKDFSYENIWYESKAIIKSGTTLKISSIEQLTSNVNGILGVHILEKMSSVFNGITLNQLINDVYEQMEGLEDKDMFMNKVAIQGFVFDEYYDDFVYALCDFKSFIVNDSFPKLTRNVLSNAIVKVQYELSVKDILEFEIRG